MCPSLELTKRFVTSIAPLAVLALALPVASFSSAIKASGNGGSTAVCEVGSCPDPEVIATSVGIGPAPSTFNSVLNFTYTFADGDQYKVSGTYDAAYTTGIKLDFAPVITYIGNNGSAIAATGTDVLSLDFLQNFYDNGPGGWSGSGYCESFASTISSTASATATATYGTQPIATLSNGPGVATKSACATLTIPGALNTASFLDADYNITATFASGSPVGAFVNSAAPEPSTITFSLISGLFCAAAFGRRRLAQR